LTARDLSVYRPRARMVFETSLGGYVLRSPLERIHLFARESREALDAFFQESDEALAKVAEAMVRCLSGGGKVVFFGNGGSAADSQHLAAELCGRFLKDRSALAALALTTDTSVLTAIGNDLGFDRVFERQVRALVNKGDVAVGLSTSAASANVLKGLEAARDLGAVTVGIAGADGDRMEKVSDHLLLVRHGSTPIIQQVHITLGHLLCGLVEEALFPEEGDDSPDGPGGS